MPRDALIAIGAGLMSAVASMAFLGGVPFAVGLVYMAPLPLIMVGLGLGVRATTFGALAGFMATGMFGGALSAGVFGLVHALPAWMTVQLALLQRPVSGQTTSGYTPAATDWYSPGDIAAGLAVIGAAMLTVVAVTMTGDQGMSSLISGHLGEVFRAMAPNMPVEHREGIAQALTPLFPGAVAASWVVMAVVNAAAAQGALVRMGRNIRPSPAYAAVDMPLWLSWPLVAAAAVAVAGSGEWEYAGRNVAMILAVPYFLLGLAVVHTLARRVAFTGPLLVAFYLIIVVSLWAALIVAGIGIAEQWVGLRNRSAATPPSPGGNDPD